ncbi:hypothetical protein FI667_g15831, partial [Globisporangium splendens]
MEPDLSLEHELEEQEDEGAFSALVAVNHKWMGHYARMHATFSVEQSLLERNSIWMNSYFQKNRMLTPPWSKEVLVTLAEDDADAVMKARQIAAQGQSWQPNMFIYTLQKRHSENETICELVSQFLAYFSERMPITSPIQLETPRAFEVQEAMRVRESFEIGDEDYSLGSPKVTNGSPVRTPRSPTTTTSSLYIEAPSPYASNMRFPMARLPTSPSEQSRRSRIFSTPKLTAVEGEKQRRCQTPNIIELHRGNSSDQLELGDGTNADDPSARKFRTLDPLDGSPPKSPRSGSPKKRAVLTEKSSWNPECINSKLKMVTKAAVRLHTKGDWLRAIELYLLALSMEINEEVEFRLRINLACAYEAAQDFTSSIGAFKAALELSPTDPYAQFKLGEVLASTGAFDEARKLFESVLSAYPQASEALKKLHLAEELQTQEEEAKRVAIAAAKRRRSPSKKNRNQQSEEQRENAERSLSDSACHPAAPPTPTNNPPTARRILPKVKKSDPRSSAPPSTPSSAEKSIYSATTEQKRPVNLSLATTSVSGDRKLDASTDTRRDHAADDSSVIPSPQMVSTMVAMTSDLVMPMGSETDTGALKPDLVTLFVKRCIDLHFDFKQYMLQMDQQQQGLIRVGSLAEIFRILGGIDPEILRYRPFLQAYEAKRSLYEYRMSTNDEHRLKPLLEDVAKKEIDFFMRRLADTKVALWLDDGIQRALGLLEKGRVSTCTEGSRKDSPAMQGLLAADVEMQDPVLPQDLHVHDLRLEITERHTPDGDALIDEEETDSFEPVLSEEESHRCVLDGYTSLSPGLDEKREKAREQHTLLREKSRIISRKHAHCMKSLRDIVARARKHQAARREALAFLKMIARDALSQIARERARVEAAAALKTGQVVEVPQHVGDHLAIAEPMEQQQAYRHRLNEVSHKVYSSVLTAALRSMHARKEL